MPPKYVKTIQEEIYYEYGKLMSRRAYAGKLNFGFITNRFKDLRDGRMTISGTIKEFEAEHKLPHECVFCGATTDLETDHLIPR
ncbi:MAG: HNH endonuclease, partial [Desulfomonilaceae bacterium]